MVRKHLSLTRAQARALKERAHRERLSEAALLRQAVDRLLDDGSARQAAVEDLQQFVREVAAARPAEPREAAADRGWTRDGLYEEREARWLR